MVAWAVDLKEHGIKTHESSLSLFAYTKAFDPNLETRGRSPFALAQVLGVLIIGAGIFGLVEVARAYQAEIYFGRGIQAAAQNLAKETYESTMNAVVTNPYIEQYHRAFAITNLSIAQGLAQKAEVSDQDKQNALVLVQQAIEQAKIATALDDKNSANWDTLTTVYQSLIGAAQDADSWTVAAMIQQIQTDPSNPQLRFNLASVYRSLGNNDQAIKLFDQAVQLKPDYANAYYNLADIYQKKGDKQNQLVMLTQTLSLLKPDNQDYDRVKKEAEDLQRQLQAESQKPVSSAKPKAIPAPTPTPEASTIPSPINLPSDAGLQPGTVPEVPQQ
jgi:tetratricopeptide (TPR) repeat protein